MTRRDFGKLFSMALVGLGLKSSPVLTTFPDGVPWPTAEQEAYRFINEATRRFIWPVYQSTAIMRPAPRAEVIANKRWQAEAWLKEQDYKFRNKELA